MIKLNRYFWEENKLQVTALLIVMAGTLCFLMGACGFGNNQGKTEIFEVVSHDKKSTLFIKRKIWGLTLDSQLTVISTSSGEIHDPDTTKDYVYKGLAPFVYQLHADTLMIYTLHPASVPIK